MNLIEIITFFLIENDCLHFNIISLYINLELIYILINNSDISLSVYIYIYIL